MMTTPWDLENFAVGFSLTEGVIQEPEDARRIRVEPRRTGCGVCGIDDLKALLQARAPEGRAPVIALSAIRSTLLRRGHEQALNELTHAVHAPPGAISTERSGVSVRVSTGTMHWTSSSARSARLA